jgi:hypothetical protein
MISYFDEHYYIVWHVIVKECFGSSFIGSIGLPSFLLIEITLTQSIHGREFFLLNEKLTVQTFSKDC